jgi:hypothetical protein
VLPDAVFQNCKMSQKVAKGAKNAIILTTQSWCLIFFSELVSAAYIEAKSSTSMMWNMVGAERTSTTPNRIVIYIIEFFCNYETFVHFSIVWQNKCKIKLCVR